jgi:hypothetical protein
MRKLCFVLTALLLTAPALATVTISCAQVGETKEVVVSYSSDDANIPRAFGLDITLDNGKTIGEITDANGKFWVYPGTIQIAGGVVTDEGEPVAPSDDPCALGGLGTGGMTIEMGSLHDPCDPEHPTGPGTSGTLLSFTVNIGPGEDCNVIIAGNGARGNVVLENTEEAVVDYGTGCTVAIEEVGCATCRGDWNGDGNVDLNTDFLPIYGKINAAKYFKGVYSYTEADTVTYPSLAPWNPCADWNGDGTVDLNTDLLPMYGKLNQAKYLLTVYTYACGNPSIDP